MSKKLWHPTSGALLAGCLMVTSAHAQQAPISPIVEPTVPLATAPVAPVPQRVAPPSAVISTPGLDLQFRDIPVKELLSTLSQQFNINLAVNADVDGVISSINLVNRTPEEALQTVIKVAGNLSIVKDNGTYIVTKKQPGAPDLSMAAPNFASGNFNPGSLGQPPISQLNNFSAPFNAGSFDNNGVSALPALGQQAMSNPPLNDLPTLVEANSGRNERRLRTIKIKNAPSALIAYQLDPANNPMPTQLQIAQNNTNNYGRQPIATAALDGGSFNAGVGFDGLSQNNLPEAPYSNPYLRNSSSGLIRPEVRANSQFGGGGGGGRNNNRGGGGGGGGRNNNRGGGGGGGGGNNAGGSFDLPGDIQQIVSVDPQNVLLVAGGTDEDIRRLQELIDVLDQPLRQVEIEAQFVELRSQDASSFGIDFSTSRGNFDAATTQFASAPVPGSFQVGFVRNNFTARLNALVADNRAKIINAPRVTAINNLTATLQSTERRSLILTSVSQNIGGQQAQGQNLLFVSTTTGLTVTPTINGDDTITVLMQPQVSTQDPGSGALGTITQRYLETVANVRDGDTIALGGLKTIANQRQNYKVPLLGDIPLIGGLFRSKTVTENESELIIFLTARIIRRAGDDINVPGT